ncbi:hypothetical protein C0993_006619 [Termitomyces sp. T159_Od127]|nr:hypothetical protein C0993_006619 [Termitomyces sp. T159_Od127]
MKLPGTSACFAAIHLLLQPINNSNEARATGTLTAPLSNSWQPPSTSTHLGHISSLSPQHPPQQSLSPLDPEALDIKIIGSAPFACILQDGTPAYQLQITLVLPEEHLDADTTTPESKTEEQILCEVVPLEYHEFA